MKRAIKAADSEILHDPRFNNIDEEKEYLNTRSIGREIERALYILDQLTEYDGPFEEIWDLENEPYELYGKEVKHAVSFVSKAFSRISDMREDLQYALEKLPTV